MTYGIIIISIGITINRQNIRFPTEIRDVMDGLNCKEVTMGTEMYIHVKRNGNTGKGLNVSSVYL